MGPCFPCSYLQCPSSVRLSVCGTVVKGLGSGLTVFFVFSTELMNLLGFEL